MENKTHTLFISYDGLADPLGSSQILPYLCGLAKTNQYQIHIVSAEKSHTNVESVKKICSQFGIIWHPVVFKNKIKGFSAWRNLKRIKEKAKSVIINYPIKLIHARTLPMAIIAKKLSQKNKTKFIFDMRGFWAHERVEGKIWNIKSPIFKRLYKKMLKAESELLYNAHAIVVLTNSAKEILIKENKVELHKISVIPCAVDLELFNFSLLQAQRESNRINYGFKPTDFVITYSGSIGTWYLLDEMLHCFKLIHNLNPNAVFNIISKDSISGINNSLSKQDIPKTAVKVTSVARNQMPEAISCSDVGLFFIRPTFSKKGSSPTKLAEFFALGIPVISNTQIGDMDEQFNKNKLGILISEFTISEFTKVANQINALSNIPKSEIVEFANQYYDLNIAVSQFHSIYSQLTSNC